MNGFLIDAVARWFEVYGPFADAALTDVVIWLRLSSTPVNGTAHARLLLMVWILKREVRAFGGCLGMYRR